MSYIYVFGVRILIYRYGKFSQEIVLHELETKRKKKNIIEKWIGDQNKLNKFYTIKYI